MKQSPKDFEMSPSSTTSGSTGDRFSDRNRDVLSRYWHPVAFSAELGDAPLGVVLLDTPLVLYRVGGRPTAALDRCPHRGARLSDGWLDDDRLICPYHGLHYDGAGHCTKIPAAPAGRIPKNLQLSIVACQEAKKLVWVCLAGEANAPLPEWACLDDKSAQYYALPILECRVAATRFCENFNDVVHFSWVHRDTFGLSGSTVYSPYELHEDENGFSHEIIYRQVDRLTFTDGNDTETDARYRYNFTLPFANHMQIDFGRGRTQHICTIASPVSAEECRLFSQYTRNYDMDEPIEEAVKFEIAVMSEDVAVLENLTPRTTVLDLKRESHIAGDRWSLAYRKRLKAIGLRD